MVILLVDDSRFQRRANEGALVRAGYKVITASDGVEGLKVARSALPDVILLDMMLPKMSGPEVLRELKSDPATVHIPVLVLSGLSQTNESKLMSEGAAGFFQKSDRMLEDDSSHLLEAIKRALESVRKSI